MQQRNKIMYTPAAIENMDEIFSFISKDNVSVAEDMLNKLDDQFGKLAQFPAIGSVLSDDDYTLIQRGFRFIVVHPYLVFYKIFDDIIIIYRILHSRRDYLRELFTEHN